MGADAEASNEEAMQCVSNYEDQTFDADDDVEVHIDGGRKQELFVEAFANGRCGGACEEEKDDATESMSSFGDTASEAENGSLLSDNEIESSVCGGSAPTSILGGCNGAFPMRRKRLTDHWRRFIRPLMWRCKWIEMQIKELQSQAQKYDRELAAHKQSKQFDYGTLTGEGLHARSLPFTRCFQRKKVMKRKKRKRLEETTDLVSYMLKHNLFSYYGKNKKSVTGGASLDDDCNNLVGDFSVKTINGNDDYGFQEGLVTLESRDTIHEDIFRKIEALKLQVHNLKTRINKVVSENHEKFSSINRLTLPAPYNPLNSSDQNPALLPENGERMPFRSPYALSQQKSAGNMGDLMPESAVSSLGEATPLPDMIESMGQPQAKQGILFHNNVSREEMQEHTNFVSQHSQKPLVPMEKQIAQASEPNLAAETVGRVRYGGKSLPKSRSNVSKNKRKRRRRRFGAVG